MLNVFSRLGPLALRWAAQPIAHVGTTHQSRLAGYVPCNLVSAQSEKCGMPQPAFRSPFNEPNLCHEFWPRPLHLGHLVCGNPTAPATRYGIGQVCERTASHVERFELAEQLASDVRHEPGANLAGEAEISSLVVADQERIHAARSRGTIA